MSERPWLIRITSPPAEPDSREMLELVLAGASLDVPLVVVFAGDGRRHLDEAAFAAWRQLVDFGLAKVVAEGEAGPAGLPERVEVMTRGQLEALELEAAGAMAL